MTTADLAIAIPATLIGVGLGVLLMAWHMRQAEQPAPDAPADARPALWVRLTNWLNRVGCDETITELMIRQQAQITSLQTSLDDAHAEVSRLCGEKRARDEKIHAVKEIVGGY